MIDQKRIKRIARARSFLVVLLFAFSFGALQASFFLLDGWLAPVLTGAIGFTVGIALSFLNVHYDRLLGDEYAKAIGPRPTKKRRSITVTDLTPVPQRVQKNGR